MSFHQYTINELYSNADGSVQFIEMAVGNANGEGFWAGHSISVSQGGTSHSFTFPVDLPSEVTANTKVLIATQGFADLGIVSPNFIIPAGFLFTSGGTVNYAGVDAVSYAQLSTDGSTSLDRNGSAEPASATNFAGVTATFSLISSGASNDTLPVSSGNNIFVDGGGGIDTAVITGSANTYMISPRTSGGFQVSGVDGMHTLINVERLKFADTSVALDMGTNQSAGETALLIGAVLGKSSLSNKALVGQLLPFFDAGNTMHDAANVLVNAGIMDQLAGGSSTSAYVNLIFHAVTGQVATPDVTATLGNFIDSGTYSKADFLAIVADLPLNQTNVDLVGLAQTGLEFS